MGTWVPDSSRALKPPRSDRARRSISTPEGYDALYSSTARFQQMPFTMPIVFSQKTLRSYGDKIRVFNLICLMSFSSCALESNEHMAYSLRPYGQDQFSARSARRSRCHPKD